MSDSYFDKYQFESDPVLLFDIANEMCKLIPENIEIIAGLEMGGIPIITILSHISKLPCAFIRQWFGKGQRNMEHVNIQKMLNLEIGKFYLLKILFIVEGL